MKNIVGTAIKDINIHIAIRRLKERYSELKQYANIIEKIHTVNVSSDAGFQKEFNYFYKIRRDAEWRTAFYNLFEECKAVESISFEHILRALYVKTGKIEASFSSKLLATLNPDMPIWDSIVLSKLGLRPSYTDDKDKRLNSTVELYQDIVRQYREFLQTPEAQDIITAFDTAFPEFITITAVKKVDFLLWGSGNEMKPANVNMEENKYLLYSHYGVKENDSSSEIIYKAAKKSYMDFCRRVYIPDHVPMKQRSALERETEELLSDMIPGLLEIAGHKGGGQEAFDSKHHEICEAVIDVYDGVGGLSYGITQRWINLTLMNLVVIESNLKTGYWPIAAARKYFHVPVEQYLLEAATTKVKNRFQHALGLKCAPLEHEYPDSYQMDWYSPMETKRFEYWDYPEYMEFQITVRNKLKECVTYQDPLDWAFKAYLEVSQARNK